MPNHYLGYPTHTDWLAAIDRGQPVNAISIIEPGRAGAHGLSSSKQVILLSQARGNTVHYLRLVTDRYQSLNGYSALDNQHHHERRAETAWKIIQTWLGEQHLIWRRAILAFPKTLRLLDGSADALMEFSRELDYWIFTDRIDPSFLEPSPSHGADAAQAGWPGANGA